MKRKWTLVLFAVALATTVVGVNFARDRRLAMTPTQESTAEDRTANRRAGDADQSRKDDEAAIREASRAFARAFEKGDAQAVANFWTEDGEYDSEDGPPIHGRAALAKAYADFFSKREAVKVEGKSDSIRFLSRDSAVEEGTFSVRAKDHPADTSRYSAFYVRENGRWLIAQLQELTEEPSGRQRLDDLGWLIGTWESEGKGPRAHVTYEWTDNKAFIRSRYTILGAKSSDAGESGTQVIGVDPASGRIHAWVFDSEGGIGESTWAWDGDEWVIDSTGTLGDGSEMTAQNFMTRTGDDSFTWRSVKRTLRGESLPDLGPVKVKRVAPKP